MTGISYQTTAEDVASKSLQVTVDVDRLEATERRAVREYARKARLPGFRKGHAPEPVVRRRFETEIRRFVLEDALRESWDTILKETELKPTADPQIRNVSFESGKTADLRGAGRSASRTQAHHDRRFFAQAHGAAGDGRDGGRAAAAAPRATRYLESAHRGAAQARQSRLRHSDDTGRRRRGGRGLRRTT